MDALLSRLLEASLQGVIAFVAVLLVVTIFRGLSPTAKCWLWRLSGLKLLIAFVFIIGVPLLPTSTTPVEQPPIPSFPTEQLVASATEATTHYQPLETTTPNWPSMLIFVWGIGAVGLAFTRLTKEIRARSEVFKLATPLRLESPGRFFLSPAIQSPLVVGLFRPTIVLPTHILDQSEELAMAVAHETAHIQRRDVLWQAVLSLTSCVFWFLPPVYWISNLAKGEAESACDQAVLTSIGTSPGQYARFLVRLAKCPSTITTLGMAAQTRHQLSRRIQAMNIRPRPRRAVLAAIAILSLPALIPWQAVAQERNTSQPLDEKLDSLAMAYQYLPVVQGGIVFSKEQQDKLQIQAEKANREVRAHGQRLEDLKVAGVSDKDRLAYDSARRMPMFLRHRKEMWDILTPEQQSRQRELVLQYLGPLVLGSRTIGSLVGLSNDQAGKIAALDQEYKAVMTKQNSLDLMQARDMLGIKEIRIRDFTNNEKARLTQLEKALYTASGKKRLDLQNEYYKIRRRAIRYEGYPDEPKSEAWYKQRSLMVKDMMSKRRIRFAELSAKALSVLTPEQRRKWVDLQGKPVTFKQLEADGELAISYR